jgi:hypothetical protein
MRRWPAAALAAACAVLPAHSTTRSSVTIGPPTIQLKDLDPNDGIAPTFFEGGPRVDILDLLLKPAPADIELEGDARITVDAPNASGGRTDGDGAFFLVVGDRFAPSFTFTATPRTEVTVSASFRLASEVRNERFDPVEPPRAWASFELAIAAVNNLTVDASGEWVYDFLAFDARDASVETPLDRPFDGVRTRNGELSLSFANLAASPAVFAIRGEMVAAGLAGRCPRP